MYLKVITMRIKDIADALHLSVSTVSKALNGGFDVSPETKEQVLKYAKENGYKSRDERLKVKSIRRLCVLFDNAVDSKSNIFIPLSLAFAEAARVNNFETITRPISDVTPSYEKFMVNNNYDGAFIVGLNYTSPFFKELETTKIPTVLYDNILNGEKVSTITNDNINTIQRLVTLLAKSGHKKIGFIHADKQSFVANERYAGYIIGLMMNNIDYNPDYVFIRLTEAYYTLAECKWRSGDKQGACDLINKVRARAFEGADPDPVTPENLDKYRFLNEWSIEFLGEARRRTDLIRWDAYVTEDWWDHKATNNHNLERFPLHNSIMASNPLLEQNPGY